MKKTMKTHGMKRIGAATLCLAIAATCTFSLGAAATEAQAATKNGIVTENGHKYYYKNGKKVTSRYGIKIGSKYYRIAKSGTIKQVSKVKGLAGIQLDKNGGNLKKSFIWAADMHYQAVSTKGKKEADFAEYGFEHGRGDCNVQAACFAEMAKVKGKKAKFLQGYASNSKLTVFNNHAWVTISGKVYDVNFVSYVQRAQNGGKTKAQAVKLSYGFHYGDPGHFTYCNLKKKKITK